jgi:hypothetical protein
VIGHLILPFLIAAGGLDRRQNQTFPRDAPKNSATADVMLFHIRPPSLGQIDGLLDPRPMTQDEVDISHGLRCGEVCTCM